MCGLLLSGQFTRSTSSRSATLMARRSSARAWALDGRSKKMWCHQPGLFEKLHCRWWWCRVRDMDCSGCWSQSHVGLLVVLVVPGAAVSTGPALVLMTLQRLCLMAAWIRTTAPETPSTRRRELTCRSGLGNSPVASCTAAGTPHHQGWRRPTSTNAPSSIFSASSSGVIKSPKPMGCMLRVAGRRQP